jgi:hypothetical protein
MHRREAGAIAALAEDADGVDDGIDIFQVGHPDLGRRGRELQLQPAATRMFDGRRPAPRADDAVAGIQQFAQQPAAEKAGGAGQQDLHIAAGQGACRGSGACQERASRTSPEPR